MTAVKTTRICGKPTPKKIVRRKLSHAIGSSSHIINPMGQRPSINPQACTKRFQIIHPASRGVAANTANIFWSVTGAKQFTYITACFFLTFVHVICIFISKSFAVICSPGRPGPQFPSPLRSSQWVFFYLFPRVGASQARKFQTTTMTTPRKTVQTTFLHRYLLFFSQNPPNPVFLEMCLHVFAIFFISKHGNLHICRHKTVPSSKT